MRVAIASDHAGFKLKQIIKNFLKRKGIEFRDFGADSEDSADYPDFGYPAAKAAARGEFDRAILICGSGVGMCILANKIPGIRAVNAYDTYIAKQSRLHGDCNVLCLGGRTLTRAQATKITAVWLKTKFSGEERHLRRIRKIEELK